MLALSSGKQIAPLDDGPAHTIHNPWCAFPSEVAQVVHHGLNVTASTKEKIHCNLNVERQCAGSSCRPAKNWDLLRWSVIRKLSNMFRYIIQSR